MIQPPVAANTPTRGIMSLDTLNAKFFRLSMEDLVHYHELASFLNEHSYFRVLQRNFDTSISYLNEFVS